MDNGGHDPIDEALAFGWATESLPDPAEVDADDDVLVARRAMHAIASARVDPPDALRSTVLAAASAARAPGPAAGDPPPAIDALECYSRCARDVFALLGTLAEDDWSAATATPYGAVRDLLAHLVGIERVTLGWLGARPLPEERIAADHLRATSAVIDDLVGAAPHALLELWSELTNDVIRVAAGADPQIGFMAHDVPANRDVALLLRSFELWAHHDDAAVAIGRSRLVVDESRMLLLSSQLVAALPFAFALDGASAPDATVRLVLLGGGGGTYDVHFGEPTSTPTAAATIVVGADDLCRLAQRRASVPDVVLVVEGDRAAADSVLAHVGAFARD